MAVNLTINGTTYAYPATGDESWGDVATNWATAVTNGMLQKAGGLFTLTADANFGANFGLTARYFSTRNGGASLGTSSVASAGQFRLATGETIAWRNNANAADLALATSASDRLQFGAVDIPTISSADIFTNKTINGANNTLTVRLASDVSGSLPLANIATIATNTILGNNTGGSTVPTALTVAQVNTLLGSLSNPLTTTGDLIYGVGSTPTRLAGNITTTKKFLTQTGGGAASAAPGWNTIVDGDLPATVSAITTLSAAAGVAIHGTNTNDSAAAGNIGEFVQSRVTASTAITSASNNYMDATSISLTAGDWDVTFIVIWLNASSTSSIADVGISTTAGNSGTGLTYGDSLIERPWTSTNSVFDTMVVPSLRMSLSGTTTVYGKILVVYSAGTPQYRCRLSARRVR